MIFNNLGLSDLSPEYELFIWQTIGCALSKNFNLSTGINDLKVAFCQINFCLVDNFSALQPEI